MYGKKGSRYPVQPGQVWGVGPHLVACGDLEAGDGGRFLVAGLQLTGKRPKLIYVDPPWSAAFVTRFRKGAGVAQLPEHTVASVVRHIASLAAFLDCPLYFEMGVSFPALEVIDWVDDHLGVSGCVYWPITYAGGKPATLFRFNSVALHPQFAGLDGRETPSLALRYDTLPGDIVFDPCLGLGCTARAAVHTQRVCWGLELHPARCSSSLADLASLYEEDPQLITTLETT